MWALGMALILALAGCATPSGDDDEATVAEALRQMAATPRALGCHYGPAVPPAGRRCER